MALGHVEDRPMSRKRHRPEEIVAKLRQVEVLTAQGQSVAEAIRSIGGTEVTYYRWRNEYGGLKGGQVKRLKELEAENARPPPRLHRACDGRARRVRAHGLPCARAAPLDAAQDPDHPGRRAAAHGRHCRP